MKRDIVMISFSGGRSSAYMTDLLLKRLPAYKVIVCFANTGKEEPETLDFVHACDQHWHGIVKWLEYDPVDPFRVVTYETASRKGEPFAALIEKARSVPDVVLRYCTQDLKILVIKRYMMMLGYKHWTNAVGIRYDERAQWSRTIGEREQWDTWLPLVDWKVTKPMVLEYWKTMPFDLRLEDYMGNCDLCFLKGKNKVKRLLAEHPEKAKWWIEQEEKIGGTFRKGISVRGLTEMIQKSPGLFDYIDPDFECFCNSD